MAQTYDITCPRCRNTFKATTGPSAAGGCYAHCDKCHQEVLASREEYLKPYIEQHREHEDCGGHLHYSNVYCTHCCMEVTPLEMDKLGTIAATPDQTGR